MASVSAQVDRPCSLEGGSNAVDRLVERPVHDLVRRLDQQVGAEEFHRGCEIPPFLGVSGPADLESLGTQGVRDVGEAARCGGFDEDSRVRQVLSMPVGPTTPGGASRQVLAPVLGQGAMARSGRWAAGRVSTAANATACAAGR